MPACCLLKLHLHRQGLSKKALQGIVNAQKEKWPASAHGRFTSKTKMTTMRAALLNPEFGFTIHRAVIDLNKPGGYLTCHCIIAHCFPLDDHSAILAHSSDDQQAQGSHDVDQDVTAASADQPVERAVTDVNEPGELVLGC
jgi:hypothetical protein